jgi:hypothetical protein
VGVVGCHDKQRRQPLRIAVSVLPAVLRDAGRQEAEQPCPIGRPYFGEKRPAAGQDIEAIDARRHVASRSNEQLLTVDAPSNDTVPAIRSGHPGREARRAAIHRIPPPLSVMVECEHRLAVGRNGFRDDTFFEDGFGLAVRDSLAECSSRLSSLVAGNQHALAVWKPERRPVLGNDPALQSDRITGSHWIQHELGRREDLRQHPLFVRRPVQVGPLAEPHDG